MIRYFTNYSYGGYEELYLGNLNDPVDNTYYLPLLSVKSAMLAEHPDDVKLREEVKRLSEYPRILKHGETPEATLPTGTFTLISNPGFKAIYRKLGCYWVFVISDVIGGDHDEMGGGNRENPFTMIFVGEKEDTVVFEALAWQILTQEADVRKVLGGLFAYDPVANGLRFSVKDLNQYLASLQQRRIIGFSRSVDIPFIFLDNGFSLKYTLELQNLKDETLGSVYNSTGALVSGAALRLAPDDGIKENPDGTGEGKRESGKKEDGAREGKNGNDAGGIGLEDNAEKSSIIVKARKTIKRMGHTYDGMSPDARKLLLGAILVSFLLGGITATLSGCGHHRPKTPGASVEKAR